MKTNILLITGLCIAIFANSALGMQRKPYQELKAEFIKANNGRNPVDALDKAAVLQRCFANPLYQSDQVWDEKNEARDTVNLLDECEGKLLDTTAVLGIVGLGLTLKKNINPAIAHGFFKAATVSLLGTTACCAGGIHYESKDMNMSRLHAFDDEKKWLINELKSLKGLPSEHTTKLDQELEKTFQEKLAQKHS